MDARLPTVPEITAQLDELEGKVLASLADLQGPVVDAVAKAADAVVTRLPDDRPEALTQGIALVVGQVDFAKQLLDTQVRFAKAVLDAAVAPVKPRPAATVKTAKGAKAA